jgi:hypothetical protein
MDYGRLISNDMLEQWKSGFKDNEALPFSTNYISIGLDYLEQYIAQTKEKYKDPDGFNGFRICFVRYPFNDETPTPQENIAREKGTDLSFPSVVLVPVKKFDPARGSAEISILENPGEIYVLALGEPQMATQRSTASGSGSGGGGGTLCPPKCG